MITHLLKNILMSIVVFFSLGYLGIPELARWAISSIPLVLGSLSILPHLVYSLTGLSFVAAVFSTLLPSQYSNAWQFGTHIIQSSASHSTPAQKAAPASTQSPPLETRRAAPASHGTSKQ
jgi:hypothetical protein